MKAANEFLSLGNYLKQINDSFANTENRSVTSILEDFRILSKEYHQFTSDHYDEKLPEEYDYWKAKPEDRENFEQNQLSSFESLVLNSIYDKAGFAQPWSYIFGLLTDIEYAKTEKTNRKVVFSCDSTDRPIGDRSYLVWNGLQIIDLDIKDAELTNKLKSLIFDSLKKFHWFLGICVSASGKGLHIWTKITPISMTLENRRVEYLCNFRHKYSYVYCTLAKFMKQCNYDKERIVNFMDMAMAKPQQGIFISSDKHPLLSMNFKDLRLDVDFVGAFDTGIESINWISHPDLKAIFAKLEWFNKDNFDENTNIERSDISNINERDRSKSIRKHYKHAQRWQLANTLNALYGFDKALQIMCEICEGTEFKELKGDIKTASIHNKPLSVWAVRELNKYHGFNIKIKLDEDAEKQEQEQLAERASSRAENPTDVLVGMHDKNTKYLSLTKNQYLSDIKDQILENMDHITLLEAGAGYGKTEMIKAFKAKTLLILPFTSTIKAKVEKSDVTSDWLYFYGSKRPTIDDLLGDASMSMTIDKFARLNVMELDTANFEYIVLDESHLLFTSSYRDVMAPTVQRLANCRSKIVLMTGTPTGELLFFPNIRHIKVTKEDTRTKIFHLNMCPGPTEQMIEMCKMMATDIIDGKKILFPTNKGNLYFEQITGIIQKYLDKTNFGRQLNAFYYKKSNFGDDSMESINIDKTIGSNDIVFCTTYLSVGVDICDRYTFSVYFNEEWIPQDIEQFANRLRNNDLYIKMFLPKYDSSDFKINYYYTQPLDLGFSKADMLLIRDLIQTCNDMIERNNEESKYNPLVSSLLMANRYLKYDENDNRYYVDETAYKLKVFEERYSAYSKQLEIMLKGVKYYGYDLELTDYTERIPEDRKEDIKEYLKSCRNMRYNYTTVQTMKFLDSLTDANIDTYKEVLAGNYDVFKTDNKAEISDQEIYTEDIEIVERNTPIVLSLYRFYDCPTIKDIYEYCVEPKLNRINFSKLDRIRRFVGIEYNRQINRLDFPVIKFIHEAQRWAELNSVVAKTEVEEFQKEWAARYANTIPDVVVEDVEYLKKIYELIREIWSIVVIQSKPKNGIVKLQPFELLWEKKESLDNLYGDAATKTFFLQELVENMKTEQQKAEDEAKKQAEDKINNTQLPTTRKYKLEHIEHELKNIVHEGYDYSLYSALDNSNDRFMIKQKNTNGLRDSIFAQLQNKNNGISYMEEVVNRPEPYLFNQLSDNDVPF